MCNANGHSPSCTCGFGGDGHLGRDTGLHGTGYVQNNAVLGDFCRPAQCQHCGASIFFVRHNSGSVWFDSLGKPWPKHECYYVNMVIFSNQDKALIRPFLNLESVISLEPPVPIAVQQPTLGEQVAWRKQPILDVKSKRRKNGH